MNRYSRGFTLIEMVIVVVIIGILAMIAIPSYQNSVDQTYRSDAQAALLSLASAMERRYTENNSYCDGAVNTGTAVANCGAAGTKDEGTPIFFSQYVPIDSTAANAIYELELTTVTVGTFELTAKAMDPGRMADDECGDFTLDSAGRKDLTGQDAGVVAADCW